MKPAEAFALVLVTAPDIAAARMIATKALESELIACANLLPGLESHYRWQGKIETSSEILLMLKTRTALVDALERLILENHPYDTPEILVLPLTSGTDRYLEWLAGCMPRPRER